MVENTGSADDGIDADYQSILIEAATAIEVTAEELLEDPHITDVRTQINLTSVADKADTAKQRAEAAKSFQDLEDAQSILDGAAKLLDDLQYRLEISPSTLEIVNIRERLDELLDSGECSREERRIIARTDQIAVLAEKAGREGNDEKANEILQKAKAYFSRGLSHQTIEAFKAQGPSANHSTSTEIPLESTEKRTLPRRWFIGGSAAFGLSTGLWMVADDNADDEAPPAVDPPADLPKEPTDSGLTEDPEVTPETPSNEPRTRAAIQTNKDWTLEPLIKHEGETYKAYYYINNDLVTVAKASVPSKLYRRIKIPRKRKEGESKADLEARKTEAKGKETARKEALAKWHEENLAAIKSMLQQCKEGNAVTQNGHLEVCVFNQDGSENEIPFMPSEHIKFGGRESLTKQLSLSENYISQRINGHRKTEGANMPSPHHEGQTQFQVVQKALEEALPKLGIHESFGDKALRELHELTLYGQTITESGWHRTVVSRAKCVGLMQVLPTTREMEKEGKFGTSDVLQRRYKSLIPADYDLENVEHSMLFAAAHHDYVFNKINKGGQFRQVAERFGLDEGSDSFQIDFVIPCLMVAYNQGMNGMGAKIDWFLKNYSKEDVVAELGEGPYGKDLFFFFITRAYLKGKVGDDGRKYYFRTAAMRELMMERRADIAGAPERIIEDSWRKEFVEGRELTGLYDINEAYLAVAGSSTALGMSWHTDSCDILAHKSHAPDALIERLEKEVFPVMIEKGIAPPEEVLIMGTALNSLAAGASVEETIAEYRKFQALFDAFIDKWNEKNATAENGEEVAQMPKIRLKFATIQPANHKEGLADKVDAFNEALLKEFPKQTFDISRLITKNELNDFYESKKLHLPAVIMRRIAAVLDAGTQAEHLAISSFIKDNGLSFVEDKELAKEVKIKDFEFDETDYAAVNGDMETNKPSKTAAWAIAEGYGDRDIESSTGFETAKAGDIAAMRAANPGVFVDLDKQGTLTYRCSPGEMKDPDRKFALEATEKHLLPEFTRRLNEYLWKEKVIERRFYVRPWINSTYRTREYQEEKHGKYVSTHEMGIGIDLSVYRFDVVDLNSFTEEEGYTYTPMYGAATKTKGQEAYAKTHPIEKAMMHVIAEMVKEGTITAIREYSPPHFHIMHKVPKEELKVERRY